MNPGWVARSEDGTALQVITVNGWQQGWVVPAGTGGTLTLTFPSNLTYRIGLFGGLALLPVLALLALLPIRRKVAGEPVPAVGTRAVADRCRGCWRWVP